MPEKLPHRVIWLFALGYFLLYSPYAALVKATTAQGFSGMFILPAVIAGTVVTLPIFIALLGWWKHVRRMPTRSMIASGVGTAAIIAATTLAYSFGGISIVLALLLMRGGVLVLAPVVDLFCKRNVRWFSWVALVLSIGAVGMALSNVSSYAMSTAAVLNLALYLSGYCVRIPMMTTCAKIEDASTTRTWFAQEALVAMATLVVVPLMLAAVMPSSPLARGVVSVWGSPALVPALGIGFLYAALYVFGTLVYLDRRENTFCIPLNRGASILSGVAASYALAAIGHKAGPAGSELIACGLMFVALLMLSPMHHALEVLQESWRLSRTSVPGRLPLE